MATCYYVYSIISSKYGSIMVEEKPNPLGLRICGFCALAPDC